MPAEGEASPQVSDTGNWASIGDLSEDLEEPDERDAGNRAVEIRASEEPGRPAYDLECADLDSPQLKKRKLKAEEARRKASAERDRRHEVVKKLENLKRAPAASLQARTVSPAQHVERYRMEAANASATGMDAKKRCEVC